MEKTELFNIYRQLTLPKLPPIAAVVLQVILPHATNLDRQSLAAFPLPDARNIRSGIHAESSGA